MDPQRRAFEGNGRSGAERPASTARRPERPLAVPGRYCDPTTGGLAKVDCPGAVRVLECPLAKVQWAIESQIPVTNGRSSQARSSLGFGHWAMSGDWPLAIGDSPHDTD